MKYINRNMLLACISTGFNVLHTAFSRNIKIVPWNMPDVEFKISKSHFMIKVFY